MSFAHAGAANHQDVGFVNGDSVNHRMSNAFDMIVDSNCNALLGLVLTNHMIIKIVDNGSRSQLINCGHLHNIFLGCDDFHTQDHAFGTDKCVVLRNQCLDLCLIFTTEVAGI